MNKADIFWFPVALYFHDLIECESGVVVARYPIK